MVELVWAGQQHDVCPVEASLPAYGERKEREKNIKCIVVISCLSH